MPERIRTILFKRLFSRFVENYFMEMSILLHSRQKKGVLFAVNPNLFAVGRIR